MACERRRHTGPARPSGLVVAGVLALATVLLGVACGGEDEGSPATGTPTIGTPATTVGPEGGEALGTGTPSGEASPEPAPRLDLTYYGHSMFLLQGPGGVNILIDPNSDIGYPKPTLPKIDAVAVSHDHSDHNKVDVAGKDVRVLNGLQDGDWANIDETVGDVHIRTIPTFHDDQQGSQRGKNSMFLFDVNGMRLLFAGDLGHVLTDEQIAAAGDVYVLLLPVGGQFTIGPAEAKQVVEQLKPHVVVPMHYKTDVVSFSGSDELQTADPFLASMEGTTVIRQDTNFVNIEKALSPAAPVILLMPYQ